MQIFVNNDFDHGPNGVGGFTQAQINSFIADENTAINILDSTFTNDISVVFGVSFGSYRGGHCQTRTLRKRTSTRPRWITGFS